MVGCADADGVFWGEFVPISIGKTTRADDTLVKNNDEKKQMWLNCYSRYRHRYSLLKDSKSSKFECTMCDYRTNIRWNFKRHNKIHETMKWKSKNNICRGGGGFVGVFFWIPYIFISITYIKKRLIGEESFTFQLFKAIYMTLVTLFTKKLFNKTSVDAHYPVHPCVVVLWVKTSCTRSGNMENNN